MSQQFRVTNALWSTVFSRPVSTSSAALPIFRFSALPSSNIQCKVTALSVLCCRRFKTKKKLGVSHISCSSQSATGGANYPLGRLRNHVTLRRKQNKRKKNSATNSCLKLAINTQTQIKMECLNLSYMTYIAYIPFTGDRNVSCICDWK